MVQISKLLPVLAFLPTLCSATELDRGLNCNLSAAEFFQPLVQRKLIEQNAFDVQGALNYFKPLRAVLRRETLTAYGMPVESVFGYVNGQMMFSTSDPRISSPDVYGVIVREEIANVQAQLNSSGNNRAKVRRRSHSLTEISCY